METEIEKSVVEGNKAIAEFMGETNLTTIRDNKVVHYDKNYHTLWDSLMPVIHKIDLIFEKSIIEERGRDLQHQIYIMLLKINIERTWVAVVEFITWYNNQKQ